MTRESFVQKIRRALFRRFLVVEPIEFLKISENLCIFHILAEKCYNNDILYRGTRRVGVRSVMNVFGHIVSLVNLFFERRFHTLLLLRQFERHPCDGILSHRSVTLSRMV